MFVPRPRTPWWTMTNPRRPGTVLRDAGASRTRQPLHPATTLALAAVACAFAAGSTNALRAQRAASPASPEVRTLRCEPAALDAFVQSRTEALARAHDATLRNSTAERIAFSMLGWLRLGDEARARECAAAAFARAESSRSADDAAWAVLATYWNWRATADSEALESAQPRLERALAVVLAAPPATLGAAALRTHAIGCAAEIVGGGRRAALEQRAREALRDFEAAHWSEEQGAFVEPGTAPSREGLLPCAIGMLAATGERAERNARRCLSATEGAHSLDRLVAAAQFGAIDAGELTARLASGVGDDPGRELDAMLFALTGLRLATGPGVDAQWIRLRPHLPHGIDRMRIDGLATDGYAIACTIEREMAAARGQSRQALPRHRGSFEVTRRRGSASWRQLVVHLDDTTFVVAAIVDEPVALPPNSGNANSDAATPRDATTRR